MKKSKLPERGEVVTPVDTNLSRQTDEGMSRRQLVRGAGAAALAMTLGTTVGSKAEAPAQAAAAAPPRGMPQGGRGPIKILLVTKYHGFERGAFFDFFDSIGDLITWTHVEQPAGRVFLDPKLAEPYDVLVFYDMDGRTPTVGTPPPVAPGTRREVAFDTPSEELKKGFEALLKSGNKGMVFFHHSCASWTHNWPEYSEAIGGVADWGSPIVVRGKQWPYSGYRDDQQQHITVVDKTHPVMEGLGEGYDIKDEVYLWPVYEDSVHCLARTDYDAIDSNFPMQYATGWRSPKGSNMCAWVKVSERTPIVYFQHGHGPNAWTNPAFKTIMSNAIKWVNTPEAKAWAKAHPTKIFKS